MKKENDPELALLTEFEFVQTQHQENPYISTDDCTFRLKHVFTDGRGIPHPKKIGNDERVTECYLHACMFDEKLGLESGLVSRGRNKCINQELEENLWFRSKEGTEDAFYIVPVEKTETEYVNIVKGTVPIAEKYCKMFENKDKKLFDIMHDVNNDTIIAAAHEMLEVCSNHLDDPNLLTLTL